MSLGLGASIAKNSSKGIGGLTPPADSFIFTVDTTKAGTAADTFELSLTSAGVIDMDVYWGDGTMHTIAIWNDPNLTHVYAAPGIYTVSIANEVRGIYFNFGPDNLKILDISNWGKLKFTNVRTFTGCSNLTCSATDIPEIDTTDMTYTFGNCLLFNGDVTGWDTAAVTNMQYFFVNDAVFTGIGLSTWNVSSVTNMQWMFGFIAGSVFNADISGWNTNSVTDMNGMFYNAVLFNQNISGWNTTGSLTNLDRTFEGAIAFDQDLSAWDVSNVTIYAGVMTGIALSTANYDALLIGWNAQAVQAAQIPNFGSSIYTNCAGAAFAARANLISSDGWTITDGGGTPASCPTPFTFSVDTTGAGSAADTFVVPLVSNGAIDLVIDWGDSTTNTIVAWNDPNLTHVYAASGTYTITITATTGTLRGWSFNWGGDKAKMRVISLWGDFEFTNNGAFTSAAGMTCTAVDVPPISSTSMAYTFFGCTLVNPPSAGSWNTSSCTSLNSFWTFCSAFNQDLDGWDVSNVTDFGGVFYGTLCNHPLPSWDTGLGQSFNQMFFGTPFNQDIDMWDMSGAHSLYSMFYNCTAFNQDLNSWDVSTVTNMSYVFAGCTSFNGNVTSWNTSSVTNFSGMFNICTVFNQNLNSWNTAAATDMQYMFNSCTAFNGDISSWNVALVQNFTQMFYQSAFNQNIGAWNTSSCTNSYGMFRGDTVFNQNISSWNMSSVLQMGVMFDGTTAFDQNISGWNVSACTDMWGMFRNATAFDQNLGGWNVANVATTDNFLQGVTLSTVNYDALLIGWDALALQSGNNFHGGNSVYSCGTAEAARANMIASDTWTITDGGSTPASCPSPFTFTVKTDNAGASANDEFIIPLVSDGVINFVVDWGDGGPTDTIVAYNDWRLQHVFAGGAGTYTITMTGTIRGWRFFWAGDPKKFLNISQWGDWDFTTYGAFAGCDNMTCTATDIPAITGTSMGYQFYGCDFNGLVAGWPMSAITDVNGMFTGCTNFNQPGVIGWDVSNCNSFSATFTNCSAFNQDISGWNVSSGTNFTQMFSGCAIFNQDLDGWNMSSANSTGSMFQSCAAFTYDLNSWDVSGVNNMSDMFYGCTLFNGNITSWNVAAVTNFQNTFNSCTAFAQDLSSWNVTSACTRTIGMFQQCVAFNADITGWNMSGVTLMNSMFRTATIFNQAIGVWNTAAVTNMNNTLRECPAFNQDISAWDIAAVADLGSFMMGTTLSTVNYDALLIAWEAQTVVSGLVPNFGSSKYTGGGAAATARAALIASDLWTITDGGIA